MIVFNKYDRSNFWSLIIWDPACEYYQYPILISDQQPSLLRTFLPFIGNKMLCLVAEQLKCHTPYAARAICRGYWNLRDVSRRAALHYVFKGYGQYGLYNLAMLNNDYFLYLCQCRGEYLSIGLHEYVVISCRGKNSRKGVANTQGRNSHSLDRRIFPRICVRLFDILSPVF